MKSLILNECPRDAMQGLHHFVSTETKIQYHNSLLKAGFSRLDFGSFVSPKAIPQLRDTAEVIGKLDLSQTKTQLLAIVANNRGAEQALEFEEIQFLGFPLSVSETFQMRNTNKTIAQAMEEVAAIQNACLVRNRKLVVYLSMAFGNPYGDPYSPELIMEFGQQLMDFGIRHLAVSDTVGMATPEEIKSLFTAISGPWSVIETTAHLHARPEMVAAKVAAAWDAGCQNFDVALGGYGGCPMAEDTLVGNMDTDLVLFWAEKQGIKHQINEHALGLARQLMPSVFQPPITPVLP